MPKYRVTVTHRGHTEGIVLTAANKDQAELKAWQILNPKDSDWGYTATWTVTEVPKGE